MNKEEFEQLEENLKDDRSAVVVGATHEDGEDVRYFGISTRFFDVPRYLNSFHSRGWMAPEGYTPRKVRDSTPRLRLIGYAALSTDGGATAHYMTFEDLNARTSTD